MVDSDAILNRLRADLARRALPERIEDPEVLTTIGALLRRSPSDRSEVKRDRAA